MICEICGSLVPCNCVSRFVLHLNQLGIFNVNFDPLTGEKNTQRIYTVIPEKFLVQDGLLGCFGILKEWTPLLSMNIENYKELREKFGVLCFKDFSYVELRAVLLNLIEKLDLAVGDYFNHQKEKLNAYIQGSIQVATELHEWGNLNQRLDTSESNLSIQIQFIIHLFLIYQHVHWGTLSTSSDINGLNARTHHRADNNEIRQEEFEKSKSFLNNMPSYENLFPDTRSLGNDAFRDRLASPFIEIPNPISGTNYSMPIAKLAFSAIRFILIESIKSEMVLSISPQTFAGRNLINASFRSFVKHFMQREKESDLEIFHQGLTNDHYFSDNDSSSLTDMEDENVASHPLPNSSRGVKINQQRRHEEYGRFAKKKGMGGMLLIDDVSRTALCIVLLYRIISQKYFNDPESLDYALSELEGSAEIYAHYNFGISSSTKGKSADEKFLKFLKECKSVKAEVRVLNNLIISDGNCLFRAVSLHMFGTQDYHVQLRRAAVDFMLNHADWFSAFGVNNAYLLHIMQDRAWGGQPEIVALSSLLGVNIEVVTPDRQQYYYVEAGRLFLPTIRLLYCNANNRASQNFNHFELLR